MSAVSRSLAERTGRTLDEWVALVQASGIDPLDQNAVRRWLRSAHGVPQNSQWVIADAAARAAGWVRPSTAEYIDSQYTGAKAALRPIYDKLAAAAADLGDDVTVEGRPSSWARPWRVPVRRRPALGWTLYGLVVLYVAVNVPVICELATPLTWPLLRATRGTLADSIVHHVTPLNLLRLAYEQSP